MGHRDRLDLAILAAIWGASFLFIKVIVREISPLALVEGRLVLGAAAVFLVLVAGERARAGRGAVGRATRLLRDVRPVRAIVLALTSAVVPFLLISWAEQHIDSGLAGILNASAPLFTAILAVRWDRSHRVRGIGVLGVLLGFLGVAVLLGADSVIHGGSVGGRVAVLLAGGCYAIGVVYARTAFAGQSGITIALTQTMTGTVLLAPFAIAFGAPSRMPGLAVIGSLLVLGLGGTGFAFILYFSLVARAGATRAIVVTYLQPPAAVIYGALLLHEPVTATAIAGLALILAGVVLTTRQSRAPAVEPEVP
jgi:drug/metabolite transporter (DMT)-like permease